jgi:hypothetical protein
VASRKLAAGVRRYVSPCQLSAGIVVLGLLLLATLLTCACAWAYSCAAVLLSFFFKKGMFYFNGTSSSKDKRDH